MPRRPDPDEAALWARVTATIRPLIRAPASPSAAAGSSPAPSPPKSAKPLPRQAAVKSAPLPSKQSFANTLDGGWDRRISTGRIAPDMTVDLHGHTLTSAHAALERSLGQAIAEGHRILLVITGRPPRPHQDPDRPRGLIRQQMPHWIAVSPHRAAIAAVRNAHPRHGGAGALYLILKRRREPSAAS